VAVSIPAAPDLSPYALNTQIPDVSGLVSKTTADGAYATKASLTPLGKVKTVNSKAPDSAGNVVISIPAAPNLTPYETSAHAAATYQKAGNYAVLTSEGKLIVDNNIYIKDQAIATQWWVTSNMNQALALKEDEGQVKALIKAALGGADGIKFDSATGSSDNYIHFGS
jgi:hypothetical protein